MACLTSLQTLKFFSLGQDEGYRIQEIGPLKNLREIDIYNLEKVTNEEEAKTAKLKEKEILKLGLYWEHEFSITMDRYDKDEKVLEGLHPHPNLKSLTIEGYGGKKFPSWVNDLSLFHNLIHIKLNWCIECEEVPTLGQLPCLRVLEIENMPKVRNIGCKFYSYSDGSLRNTTTLFPALRILKLECMESLEEWKDAKELTSAGEVLTVFPSLEELTLRECSHLRYLPGVPSVIRHLEIMRCGIDELPSGLQFCTSLQYLKIEDCPNLKSIPESLHTCVSLQKFVIQDCPHLSSLRGVPSVIQHLEIIGCGIDELPSGLHLCTSLQYLGIKDCSNLKSIPDLGEVFHSLIHLKISNCPGLRLKLSREGRLKALVIGGFIEELDAFPILRYPSIQNSHASLKKLILVGRPTLNSLPNEIQLLTALEELQICNFNGMEALPDWFSYLSSLQKLFLYHCKNLMSLPILHLTNLKHLGFFHCRNLEKRYAKGSGAGWFQIAHVPNIRIDGEHIQGNTSEDFEIFRDADIVLDVIDDSEDD
ncbi:hypothetical protein CMV_024023 [Castanea mollissima]|uniref:R13L1/DRL21-like LRR repeat region domain-containing protein n=1 Tax=Castanea mollissima TaxID=60419 RepID=A0A8J4V682_9ROSI|nr:hypothetical protein CMV_024023 [Castanea mollissima]